MMDQKMMDQNWMRTDRAQVTDLGLEWVWAIPGAGVLERRAAVHPFGKG